MRQLEINRDSTIPAYRQITQGVTALVKRGSLKPGDKPGLARTKCGVELALVIQTVAMEAMTAFGKGEN